MKRNNILLGLIIILAVLLRFFYLGRIPNGLYSDEAAFGYNAYSLLKTGKDEHGNVLPVAFKSFGDYKAPLYIYFLIPFVGILGLSEISVRTPSAVLGVGVVILIYFLVKEMTKYTTIALLSSFLAAITPLSLQFNRMAHENNLVVFLMTAGILFFIFSFQNTNYIFLFFFCLAASIYTYHDARVLIPIFIVVLFYFYRQNLWQMKEKVLAGFIIFIILLLPLIRLFGNEAIWSRPKNTIVFSDIGISLNVNNEREEDKASAYFAQGLFHNKAIEYPKKVLANYLTHFSPDFLFFSGDPVRIYNTVGNGILLIAELPFLFLGLYFLFRKNISHKWIIFFLLILAPIPAALTKFVPSASRILSILPALSIIPAFGLTMSIKYLNNRSRKIIYIILISVIFSFNIAYYLHYYYVNTPVRYAKDWHYGVKSVMEKVKAIEDNYQQVWFSKNVWGYIYPLFYFSYPPERYQKQVNMSSPNEYGFGWVEKFDKYIFADFPSSFIDHKNTLFVGSPDDFSTRSKRPLHKIIYPDGTVAFYIANIDSF